jgi:hypothetical protein
MLNLLGKKINNENKTTELLLDATKNVRLELYEEKSEVCSCLVIRTKS